MIVDRLPSRLSASFSPLPSAQSLRLDAWHLPDNGILSLLGKLVLCTWGSVTLSIPRLLWARPAHGIAHPPSQCSRSMRRKKRIIAFALLSPSGWASGDFLALLHASAWKESIFHALNNWYNSISRRPSVWRARNVKVKVSVRPYLDRLDGQVTIQYH